MKLLPKTDSAYQLQAHLEKMTYIISGLMIPRHPVYIHTNVHKSVDAPDFAYLDLPFSQRIFTYIHMCMHMCIYIHMNIQR
jgi:hypothetical protein